MLAREGALSEGREEREKEKKIRGQGLQASGGRLSEVENDDMAGLGLALGRSAK